MKNNKLSEHPIIVILGLISSVIAIFAFITGIQDIFDVGAVISPEPSETPTRQFTNIIEANASSTPTQTPESVKTNLSELESKYSIVNFYVTDIAGEKTSDGNIKVYLFANKTPIVHYDIYLYNVVYDITGKPATQYADDVYRGYTDNNGALQTKNLPLAEYAISLKDDQRFLGPWGERGSHTASGNPIPRELITVPVYSGKTTIVEINFSVLEIGYLSKDGSTALTKRLLILACPSTDIVGNISQDERCDGTGGGPGGVDENAYSYTDTTGVAIFYVVPGTYFVYEDSGSGIWQNYILEQNIIIGEDETKRIIINN